MSTTSSDKSGFADAFKRAAVKFARFNILAYFIAGAAGFLAGNIRILIGHGVPIYSNDIVLLWLVLFSPVGYLLYLYVRNRRQKPYSAPVSE